MRRQFSCSELIQHAQQHFDEELATANSSAATQSPQSIPSELRTRYGETAGRQIDLARALKSVRFSTVPLAQPLAVGATFPRRVRVQHKGYQHRIGKAAM